MGEQEPSCSHMATSQSHLAASVEHLGKGQVCDRLLIPRRTSDNPRVGFVRAGSAKGSSLQAGLCVPLGRVTGVKPWIDYTVVP